MTRAGTAAIGAIGIIVAITGGACARAPEFDLIVRSGSVFDGTGQDVRALDVGINGDRITAITDLSNRTAGRIIDATGKTIAPGFIDLQARSGINFLSDGYAESALRQGITTEVLGAGTPAFWTAGTADAAALRQRGLTLDWTNLAGFMNRLESHGIALNVGTYISMSDALASGNAVGFVNSAMTGGAFGVVEDVECDATELREVAAVVGRHNGLLITRVDDPVAANDDLLFEIGGAARRTVISDVSHAASHDAIDDLMHRVVRARDRGLYVGTATTVYPAASAASDALAVEAVAAGSLIETDTPAVAPTASGANPDPAAFGTFPRLLGQYARDRRILDFREAARRVTSGAAAALDVPMRGILREGYFADLVVFDRQTIADRSTASAPNQPPSGIDYVVVNGVVILTPRGLTGARPGYSLTHRTAAR